MKWLKNTVAGRVTRDIHDCIWIHCLASAADRRFQENRLGFDKDPSAAGGTNPGSITGIVLSKTLAANRE